VRLGATCLWEVGSQVTSGTAVDNTQIVVQGLPNRVIRYVARTMDLESESRVGLLTSDAAFQRFSFDLCYGRLERFDFLWGSRNGSRIQYTLFVRQSVEPLEEFDDEVVAL